MGDRLADLEADRLPHAAHVLPDQHAPAQRETEVADDLEQSPVLPGDPHRQYRTLRTLRELASERMPRCIDRGLASPFVCRGGDASGREDDDRPALLERTSRL